MINCNLKKFLESPAAYTSLELKNQGITDEDCQKIASAIPQAEHLIWINLEHNQISGAGAMAIAQAVADKNGAPLILNLEYNKIDDLLAREIQELLGGDNCQIQCQLPAVSETEAAAEITEGTTPPAHHHYTLSIDTNLRGGISSANDNPVELIGQYDDWPT
jgi:hypothetical protein